MRFNNEERIRDAVQLRMIDVDPRNLLSAEFTFRTVGPFPNVKDLEGKIVEIRVLD